MVRVDLGDWMQHLPSCCRVCQSRRLVKAGGAQQEVKCDRLGKHGKVELFCQMPAAKGLKGVLPMRCAISVSAVRCLRLKCTVCNDYEYQTSLQARGHFYLPFLSCIFVTRKFLRGLICPSGMYSCCLMQQSCRLPAALLLPALQVLTVIPWGIGLKPLVWTKMGSGASWMPISSTVITGSASKFVAMVLLRTAITF